MANIVLSYPGRSFQLWAYVITHSQVLLRSTRVSAEPRLDIFFSGVKWLNIPSHLSGLELSIPDPAEARSILSTAGIDGPGNVYSMSGDCYSGFMVADGFEVDEANRDYNQVDRWGVLAPEYQPHYLP